MAATNRDILQWYSRLSKQALARDLAPVVQEIRQMARDTGESQYLVSIDGIMENYRLILGFFENGTPDERRAELHDNVVRQIMELLDRFREDLLRRFGTDPVSRMKRDWLSYRKPYGAEATQWAEGLAIDRVISKILEDTHLQADNSAFERKAWLDHLFNLAWLPDKLQDEEATALAQAIQNEQIPWYERAMLVSGLSLGLLRAFDQTRFMALIKLIQASETEVRARALTGLIFALVQHQVRLPYYPALQQALRVAFELSTDPREVEAIYLQWLRSLDTEALGQTLREELLPGMMRITPRITERFKLDDILPGEDESEKNPDWEKVFEEDPDLLDKLQRFTERHLAGDDVFMTVFSQQKHYPFFQYLAHWFLPFHLEEPVVTSLLEAQPEGSSIARLIRDLEETELLSHSDKYSFVLNLAHLNEMQQDLLKATFSAEVSEYQKLKAEEERLDDMARFRSIVRMYLQDLYRFHELHEFRHQVPNVFKLPQEGLIVGMMASYLQEHGIDRTLAFFHFEREHWRQAAYSLARLAETGPPSHSLFEKTGYAFQQIQEYERALDFYRKAELFDTNRSWLLKRMAYCYRKSGLAQEAIRIYDESLKEKAGDVSMLVASANILLEIKDYKGALTRYREAELRDTDNLKLLRPMAWCFLNMGKAGDAIKVLDRIPETEKTYYDFMNLGHAWWIQGDISQAATAYKQGLSRVDNPEDDFMKGYQEDRNMLHRSGINERDTAMMADLLRTVQISS